MRGGPPPPPSGNDSQDSAARQAASRVVAVADERTNSLVVSAPDELMPTIEELVSQVDTAAEDITEVRVFHLQLRLPTLYEHYPMYLHQHMVSYNQYYCQLKLIED